MSADPKIIAWYDQFLQKIERYEAGWSEDTLKEALEEHGFKSVKRADVELYWRSLLATDKEGKGTAWKRDLLRECVEANPGPVWSDIRTKILEEREEEHRPFWKRLLDDITTKLGESFHDHFGVFSLEEVHQFISLDIHKARLESIHVPNPVILTNLIKLITDKLAPPVTAPNTGSTDIDQRFKSIESKLALMARTQGTYSPTSWGDRFLDVTTPQSIQPLFNNSHAWSFASFDFGRCVAGNKETKVVQPYFTRITPDINRLVGDKAQSILFDGHAKVTFLTRRPDHVAYKVGCPFEPFYITAFGDNKGCYSGMLGFTDEDKGHLLDFASNLAKVQRFRSFVYGFLTNGITMQWFRFTFKDGEVKCDEFPVINYNSAGLHSLCCMLASKVSGLGWELPSIQLKTKSIELRKVLGYGAFSIVYQGELDREAVVVKHFPKLVTDPLGHIAAHRDTEIVMLAECNKHAIQGVTEFLGLTVDKQAIILSPLGTHFARTTKEIIATVADPNLSPLILCTAAHLSQIVAILQQLHRKDIIHRDVRAANFFKYPNSEKVFLNDFGAAVKIDSRSNQVEFIGAKNHAPLYIRKGLLLAENAGTKYKYKPSPADDLHMVVCTLFQLTNTAIYEGILKCSEERQIQLWELYFSKAELWVECCSAAKNKEYFLLQRLITQALP